jgi:hypothetical protein
MTNATSPTTQTGVLALENPVFCAYLISSCLLVVKMMLVALMTAYKRTVHKVSTFAKATFSFSFVVVRRSYLLKTQISTRKVRWWCTMQSRECEGLLLLLPARFAKILL